MGVFNPYRNGVDFGSTGAGLKLRIPDVPVWVYHVKPQLYQETAEELAKIDSTRIHILEQGKTYTL